MNRRGHLSSKVPNVKLRPAPANANARAGSSRRAASPKHRLDDDGEDDDVEVPLDAASNRPWEGITVTFTGVENKVELSELVRQLGGAVESALTVNVTHVIATGYGSAKYLYAVEHRIPVQTPEWITDSHLRWVQGEELSLERDTQEYRLLPFVGLKIAISGIDNLPVRRQIIHHIQLAGGEYSKDLDRSCTHLVSAFGTREPKAKSSEKIKWALKEIGDREMARRRGKRVVDKDIRIVYEEWIWDCAAFGGRWKEDAYDASKPRPKGKVTYEQILDGSAFLPPEAPPQQQGEEEEEPAVVRKRKRDNIDNLVGELLSTREAGKPDVKRDTEEAKEKEEGQSRGASSENSPADALPSRSSVFERKPSVLHASRSTAFGPSSAAAPSGDRSSRGPPAQMFALASFTHVIEGDCTNLENALRHHGGTIVPADEWRAGRHADYVVVRLASNPPLPKTSSMVVTDCWVEACCFREEIIAYTANLVYTPLTIPVPLPGADAVRAHISGFPSETSAYLHRLCRALGATVSDSFNRRTTHLICGKTTGPKFEKAQAWRTPAVRESWVWESARKGALEPLGPHLHPVQKETLVATASPRLNRDLRPTPTHIEALSPSTERALNLARASPASVSADAAAPASSPLRLEKAATVAAAGGAHGNDEVTAALRRLAQGPQRPARPSSTRRARPSNPRRGTPTPSSTSTDNPAVPAVTAPPAEEESVRVTYADPASERERRRLLDAVNGASPKRARV